MLLQSRGRMSARALAGELEVSVRTLHRDVDHLSAAGVPVYAERGRSGGFALLEGWRTTLTGLTPAEAQAVFLSGLAGPAAQLGLGGDLKAARLKLVTALPAAWRDHAQIVSSRLHLDPMDWHREQEPTPLLSVVAEAVWNERELAVVYESWKKTSAHTVGALGLVVKAGIWYLVAKLGDRPRTFRVSNLRSAQLLDSRIRQPKGFDLAAYWIESIKRFEHGLYTREATLLATQAGRKALTSLGSVVATRVARAVPTRRRDGRVRLRIPIESIEDATGQLLKLSPEVEVLEPLALRQSIIERVRNTAKLYGVI